MTDHVRSVASVAKTAALATLAVFTVGPLTYYTYVESTRFFELRRRRNRYHTARQRITAAADVAGKGTTEGDQKEDGHAGEEELNEIKARYSTLIIGGRFQNPFEEWREQGAWEWLFWKLIWQPLTGRFLWNGGLPRDRSKLAQDLPVERPSFELLFGFDPESISLGSVEETLIEGDESGITTVPSSKSSIIPQAPPSKADIQKGPESVTELESGSSGDEMAESWTHLSQTSSKAGFRTPTPPGVMRAPLERPDPIAHAEKMGKKVKVGKDLTFTWIGQSTCFIQLEGLNILTDPVFGHRTLDSVLGPARLRPPPCPLSSFIAIDIVLVSHSHPDHLDYHVVDFLGNSVRWFVPIGLGDWFRRRGVWRVREMAWWDKDVAEVEGEDGGKVDIIATPAMHWTARTPFDTNQSLWCSFVLKGQKDSFFHCGDTGYSESMFEAIGRAYGPISLAAIPIGAYKPRWHLSSQHVDPEGAVKIHRSIGAKKSIGVHWGTWILSDERYDDPPKDLVKARSKLGVEEDAFSVIPVGRTIVVN